VTSYGHTPVTLGLEMATIRKRHGRWQVQIRRKGSRSISKSFLGKSDALRWAREQERAVDLGDVLQSIKAKAPTLFSHVVDRYEAEVIPRKRSPSDRFHLRPIRAAAGFKTTRELAPGDLAAFRDARLNKVSPSTVRREMILFLSVMSVANREWGERFQLDSFKAVKKPAAARGRERRVEVDEWSPLFDAIHKNRNPLISRVVRFAVATGLRRGEILSLKWRNIDLKNRVCFLPMTKNGHPRQAPLSSSAIEILIEQRDATRLTGEVLEIQPPSEVVFPVSANAVRLAWSRALLKAGIRDLRFHDLRHEAISQFFERGLTVVEVGLISGHRDVRMLHRYVQLRAADVAKKIV